MDCRCWDSVAAVVPSFLHNIMPFFLKVVRFQALVFVERPLISQRANHVIVSIYNYSFNAVFSIWFSENTSGVVHLKRHTDTSGTWLESGRECFLHNLGRSLLILDSATVCWKVIWRWCMPPLHICHLLTVNASFTQLTPPRQEKCNCK